MLRLIRHTLRYPLLSSLSLLIAIACTSLVLVLPAITMRFIDIIIGQNRPDLIISTAIIGATAILTRQILLTLRSYLNNHLELKLTHLIRVELYSKLQRLPIKWFDQNSSGEIMSRIADDVPATNRVIIEGLDQAISSILQFLIVISYLLYHSWQLTLITLIPLPFIGIITAWWSKKAEPKWTASSEASSALNATLHDNLAGIRQIKAYTVEPETLSDFNTASKTVADKHMEVMKGQAIVWPSVSFIAEIGIILMVALGAHWTLNHNLSPGTVIAFLVAWGFLFEPISRINPLSQTFTKGLVSAKRLFKIIDTPDETHITQGLRPATLSGKIELKNITFGYTPEATALKNISLTAHPGQTLALVGATGSGKTTILNLLSRFYEPTSGQILLDENPIADISKEWLRDHTGLVTQDPFLFNTTIRQNLTLAKQNATDKEIWAALEAANAAEFVHALPKKLETTPGERGALLSGGEKQRLSIARALLKNPPILLLDEATSALDNTTEKLIQQALDNLRTNRTSIVIAHRLSTIQNAHQICLLHHGQIVEQGTHQQLLEKKNHYYRLHQKKTNPTP